jgi:hypothetical protein
MYIFDSKAVKVYIRKEYGQGTVRNTLESCHAPCHTVVAHLSHWLLYMTYSVAPIIWFMAYEWRGGGRGQN